MENLAGHPHYQIIARYGYHETLLAVRRTYAQALGIKSIFMLEYPQIIIRWQPF